MIPKILKAKNTKILIWLFLLVCLAYANSLKGAFVSDDTREILNNPQLDEVSFIFREPTAFLRPLFYFLINKAAGRNPLFFRLMNIFFHLGCVVVVYLLVSYLINLPAAVLAASIFAVHPVESESVSWISGGIYAQYSFFVLLALYLYVLSFKHKRLFYWSLASFILALFSSIHAAVFALLAFLFVFIFENLKKYGRGILVFFLVDALWVVVYVFKIGTRISDLQNSFYQQPQLFNPLIQIPIAVTSYLELIFWPKELTIYHSQMVFSYLAYGLRLIMFIIFLIWIWRSHRRNRQQIFFWSSFFLVSLLPFLTPLGISWVVAERYAYLGAIGIFVLIAIFLSRLFELKRFKFVAYLLSCVIILALLGRTVLRNRDWRNEDNLWLATAKTSPESPHTHNNLGDVYCRHGKLGLAAEEFKKAVQIKPNYADAYHNLALTYQKMGRIDEAILNYQKAIQFNPRLWQSYQNLSSIYFLLKKFDLAKENIQAAIDINPGDYRLYVNLAVVYLSLNNKPKAKQAVYKALELNPGQGKAKEILNILQAD